MSPSGTGNERAGGGATKPRNSHRLTTVIGRVYDAGLSREEIMNMRSVLCRFVVLCVAVPALSFMCGPAYAQKAAPSDEEVQDMARGMGMDPKLCGQLQNQVNQVVNIGQSSLGAQEKLTKLQEVLTGSLAGMQKSAENDPEIGMIVKQYTFVIAGLLATVSGSAATEGKQVSPESKNELEKLKVLTTTYVNMVKMMCPKLTLPEVLNK